MLLLLAAVPLETTLIRTVLGERLRLITSTSISRQDYHAEVPLMLSHTGIGPINMAMQLGRILTFCKPEAVILFGCGGAYPHSGLALGDSALATSETLGDTGVAIDSDFIPLDQLKIPQDPELAPLFRQSYTLSQSLLEHASGLLPDTLKGPFVTVSTCSGHPLLSEQLEARTGGVCENMEGAAAAQVCEQFQLPLLEIRGISNPTGTRDPRQWDICKGTAAAQNAVIKLVDDWS